MEIKASDLRSGDLLIDDKFSAMILNVRRLMVCGTPQIIHVVLDNSNDDNPGSLLYDVDEIVKVVERYVRTVKDETVIETNSGKKLSSAQAQKLLTYLEQSSKKSVVYKLKQVGEGYFFVLKE